MPCLADRWHPGACTSCLQSVQLSFIDTLAVLVRSLRVHEDGHVEVHRLTAAVWGLCQTGTPLRPRTQASRLDQHTWEAQEIALCLVVGPGAHGPLSDVVCRVGGRGLRGTLRTQSRLAGSAGRVLIRITTGLPGAVEVRTGVDFRLIQTQLKTTP